MKERPVTVLVDALRYLGATIDYVENEGFPPLKVKGTGLSGGKITIKADVSSQYITALLLIAPKLEQGLELILEGEITSLPYLHMTIELLNQMGIKAAIHANVVTVIPAHNVNPVTITVESDWSSASYFYSIIAMAEEGAQVSLSSFRQNSLQGDSAVVEIYQKMGVLTEFRGDSIILRKAGSDCKYLNLNLINTPDIAQTIAVTCFGLGIACTLTGLHTLKIKETDRLTALKNELTKLGAVISVTDDSLMLKAGTGNATVGWAAAINTYNDHRMAMSFAALAVKAPIVIKDAGVVSKSHPRFWEDLKILGIQIETK